MLAVLITRSTVMQNKPFFPSNSCNRRYSLVLTVLTRERISRLSWPGWLIPRQCECYSNSQTVTHPSTNRTQHRLTLLMCAMPSPLSQAATFNYEAYNAPAYKFNNSTRDIFHSVSTDQCFWSYLYCACEETAIFELPDKILTPNLDIYGV